MKWIISNIFLFFTLMAYCQSVKIDNIKYEVISPTEAALVDGYKYKASSDLVIPEYVTIKGKPYKVVEIKRSAFHKWDKGDHGNNHIRSIVMPNSVVTIGEEAFSFCLNLESVKLSECITELSESIFYHCTTLTNVVIPDGVIKIGKYAFTYTDIESVIIPNGVTEIGASAFKYCRYLKDVTLPKNLIRIDDGAFGACNLSNINIPDGTKYIGEGAFILNELKSVYIPNSVTYIGDEAFKVEDNLREAVVPDSLPTNSGFLRECKNLKNIRGHNVLYPEWLINEIASNPSCYSEELVEFANAKILEKKNSFTEYIKKAVKNNRISQLPTVEDYIKPKVERDINLWQEKGEFESSAKWKQRVNETTRNEKVKELASKYKNEYLLLQEKRKKEYEAIVQEFYAMKEKNKSQTFKAELLSLSTYDADNESFMIKSGNKDFADILLPVKIEDAPSFKADWEKIKMTAKLIYVPSGDDVALTSITFKHDGKTYTYDSNTQAKYAITDVDYNFKPIDLSIDEGLAYSFNPLEAAAQNVVTTPHQDISRNNNTVIERKKLSAGELSDVDVNVPVNSTNATNTFAVIIGNENYSQVAKVPYAQNDAKVFAEYCKKTLGLPDKNIKCYNDATFGIMLSAIENIQNIAKAYKGNINVIFYYAGHGVPNESSNDAYLLPVDANGRNTAVCYAMGKLYDDLKALNAKCITVFLDACFSGAQRGDGMLASARGVAIKAKQAVPQGNMVVFSAASGDETAYPFNEKGHGLFTYYLLKKLKETKGNVTLGELGQYISEKVVQESVVTNGKSQTPTVVPSSAMSGEWRNWRLK